MAVADKNHSFIISGTGDVLEPEDGIIGIGSGGNYALAAAKVLMDTELNAEEVAKKAIKVAADICVFTFSVVSASSTGSFTNIFADGLNPSSCNFFFQSPIVFVPSDKNMACCVK